MDKVLIFSSMFEPFAETLQLIRERTRLAMQDPKVMSCKHNFMNKGTTDEDLIKKRRPLNSSRNSRRYSTMTFINLFNIYRHVKLYRLMVVW